MFLLLLPRGVPFRTDVVDQTFFVVCSPGSARCLFFPSGPAERLWSPAGRSKQNITWIFFCSGTAELRLWSPTGCNQKKQKLWAPGEDSNKVSRDK